MTNPRPVTAIAFTDDESIDVVKRARTDVPDITVPAVPLAYATSAGKIFYAYLIVQLSKSSDHTLTMAIVAASAAAFMGVTTRNVAGTAAAPRLWDGLDTYTTWVADHYDDDDAEMLQAEGEIFATNFPEEEVVTFGEIKDVMQSTPEEMAFYLGLMFLAGVKQTTASNLSAFNEKRIRAVKQFVSDELHLFKPAGPFLDISILNRVYTAFNVMSVYRKHIIVNVLANMGPGLQGTPKVFVASFLLSAGQGMTTLSMIKEACIRYPELPAAFPSLRTDMIEVQKALNVIEAQPAAQRPFLKAIHGADYVPVSLNAVNNLLGICREALIPLYPSYANYQGGRINDDQKAFVANYLATRVGSGIAVPPPIDNSNTDA